VSFELDNVNKSAKYYLKRLSKRQNIYGIRISQMWRNGIPTGQIWEKVTKTTYENLIKSLKYENYIELFTKTGYI